MGAWLAAHRRRRWDRRRVEDVTATVRADLVARGLDPDAPAERGEDGVRGAEGVRRLDPNERPARSSARRLMRGLDDQRVHGVPPPGRHRREGPAV